MDEDHEHEQFNREQELEEYSVGSEQQLSRQYHDHYSITSDQQHHDRDDDDNNNINDSQQMEEAYSVTGANLRLDFHDLHNLVYLTEGGNNWIHTAVMNQTKQIVIVKQLKPEVTEAINAMDEIESELKIHALLDHRNIVTLYGAGYDRHGKRFIVLEHLANGSMAQRMGYDRRIRDSRKRFFKKKATIPYDQVLKYAQQIAAAMDYLHRNAVDGSMIIHRDLKPDNIGKKDCTHEH